MDSMELVQDSVRCPTCDHAIRTEKSLGVCAIKCRGCGANLLSIMSPLGSVVVPTSRQAFGPVCEGIRELNWDEALLDVVEQSVSDMTKIKPPLPRERVRVQSTYVRVCSGPMAGLSGVALKWHVNCVVAAFFFEDNYRYFQIDRKLVEPIMEDELTNHPFEAIMSEAFYGRRGAKR